LISVRQSDGVFLVERDMRRRGAFSLYWDSNGFALIFSHGVSMVLQTEKTHLFRTFTT
jgi:hypothetical protein